MFVYREVDVGGSGVVLALEQNIRCTQRDNDVHIVEMERDGEVDKEECRGKMKQYGMQRVHAKPWSATAQVVDTFGEFSPARIFSIISRRGQQASKGDLSAMPSLGRKGDRCCYGY